MKSNVEVPLAVEPFESDQEHVFVSKLITDGVKKARSNFESMLDNEDNDLHTYFASKTKLNEAAMVEYDLKRLDRNEDKDDGGDHDDGRPLTSENAEWIDKFDSRGQKMRIRRGQIMQG